MAPAFALCLSAVVFIVTLLFPEVEDAAQRSFRGLMVLLGGAAAGLPGLLVLILFFALGAPILLATPFVTGVYAGTAALMAVVCGGLYASYNPSE
jgi:hypothetical protein